eukprot:CAMPEP_0169399166 /NCGR_PEP_ID=MMETSP1017-20121227/53054_1 /TAXON_ID=342587 /ORGANISM="Karlodinium micrum, Strain CCMP2283" /LENGTH=119 /DNA_ID=CAMNT_0009504249 /DNA_START=420 /DNA_END=779 /DNA_ORIENTATION=-
MRRRSSGKRFKTSNKPPSDKYTYGGACAALYLCMTIIWNCCIIGLRIIQLSGGRKAKKLNIRIKMKPTKDVFKMKVALEQLRQVPSIVPSSNNEWQTRNGHAAGNRSSKPCNDLLIQCL